MRRTFLPLPLSAAALERIDRVARKIAGGAVTPERLGDAVRALSRVYTRDRDQIATLPSDQTALLARVSFFLARDLPKVFGPLDELAALGRVPSAARLRVLDIGAGLGATSFGLARWLRLRRTPAQSLPVQSMQVVALEQSASALRAFSALALAFGELPEEFVPVELEAHAADLRSAHTLGKFDVVLLGFVLNELARELPEAERIERRAELLAQASAQLREGGVIIVLEPALRETSRELMQLRDRLLARGGAPYVLAPCLHDQSCPMLPKERDWCHQELPYVLPPALAEVARTASLRFEGLRYSSLVLANSPRASGPPLVRIVSDRLESKGKLELFGCSERGYTRLTRLTRDATAANEGFGAAQRGDVLAIDLEAARVGKETRVTKR